jgi:hypothetical protein
MTAESRSPPISAGPLIFGLTPPRLSRARVVVWFAIKDTLTGYLTKPQNSTSVSESYVGLVAGRSVNNVGEMNGIYLMLTEPPFDWLQASPPLFCLVPVILGFVSNATRSDHNNRACCMFTGPATDTTPWTGMLRDATGTPIAGAQVRRRFSVSSVAPPFSGVKFK